MSRFAATSCLFLILGLSSFQKPQVITHGKVAKDMPRVGRKQARQVWLETLEMYANKQEWTQLGHIAKAAIEDGVSMNQILEVAQKTNQIPFLRAVVATQNMRTLPGNMGILKNELFRIALFIETDFEKVRQELGTNYLSRRRTGLERTLEYFPETNMVFIHLKKHGVDEVGRGVKKVVTKSILYDVENPQMAARCASSYQMRNEMAALQHMQGADGIVKLYACSERVAKDGTPVYYMMCKLYEGGALSKAFKQKYKFTYKQKLIMTHDLLEGLHALHSQGLIHRDLTARNILLENTKKGSRKSRDIRAVIADFGRIKHVDSANGIKVQFNSSYLPPEGIIAEKLSGEDYYATDLFALGCILHRLHTGKPGSWVNKANLKNPTQPDAVKEAKFIYELEKYRDRKLAKLLLGKEPENGLSTKTRLQHMLLQLVHPDPTKRGTAQEHMQTMKQILADFEKEPQDPESDVVEASNEIQEQLSESTQDLAF